MSNFCQKRSQVALVEVEVAIIHVNRVSATAVDYTNQVLVTVLNTKRSTQRDCGVKIADNLGIVPPQFNGSRRLYRAAHRQHG